MTTDTRAAFETWDQDGNYADWKEFDSLTRNEQFFLCFKAATLAERERCARVAETGHSFYQPLTPSEIADKIRSGE